MRGIEAGSAYTISCSFRWKQPLKLHKGYPARWSRRLHVCSSKAQDCQSYARPLRLLPVTEVNCHRQSSLEKMSTSIKITESRSMYVVKLQTSTASSSSLSDLNAGVLLCLIDENGDSVLHRLSAISVIYPPEREASVQDFLCFQRGSTDEFTFEGPELGRIDALWLGLESGCWRCGGVSLTVVYGPRVLNDHTAQNGKVKFNSGLVYNFQTEDIIFGASEDASMVELRPCHITELSEVDLVALLDVGSRPTSLLDREISNEESMREYADLKSSLLIYDSVLILTGTLIAAISSGEKAAFAFFIGGVGGFLYLLLLQKSVDRLPTSDLSPMREEDKLNQLFGQVKGPIGILVLVFVFAVVPLQFSGATHIALTAQEIFVGMTGFLSCKGAVLWAAFNPMPIQQNENK